MADTTIAYLHPNDVSASFLQSLTALYAYDRRMGGQHLDEDLEIKVRCATGGVPEGRNMAAAAFLSSNCEWLFIVDADMGFAPNVIDELHLVADPVERPVVGALCFAQRELTHDGLNGFRCEARPTIYDWVEHADGHKRFTGRAHYPINTVVRCDATGAACMLIHRTVIERILEQYGPTWFDRTKGTDGSLLGEDIAFCLRCGALDIPIHVFTGVKTSHHKELWLGEMDFWSQFRPPPATERVDVIVPVLHRPQNVPPFMESLRASTGLATAWFVCDDADPVEQIEVEKYGGKVFRRDGSFAQKVNYACVGPLSGAPWIFLAGDDVVFRPGWLDHAQFVAGRYDASVVGTNDLGNKSVIAGDHATHMLIRRSYIDEVGADFFGTPGTVCSEEYRHWFVDNEIVLAAKRRGVWQMAIGSIVEHMHPLFGKGADDDVYALGQSFAEQDRATFLRRVEESKAA